MSLEELCARSLSSSSDVHTTDNCSDGVRETVGSDNKLPVLFPSLAGSWFQGDNAAIAAG